MAEENQPNSLTTGQYTIEFSNGPSVVYRFDQEGNKSWIASCPDPDTAMNVVEGMILVEHKRFYYPNARPRIHHDVKVKDENKEEEPSFLKRK